MQGLRRPAGADDGGDTEFAADDRGVRGAAAVVGDDGGSPLHDRLPVRVGDAGDEHPAGREAVEVDGSVQNDDRPAADGFADGDAVDEGCTGRGGQAAAAQGGGGAAGLYGLGPGLHDPQVSGEAVLGPFQVHGAAVVPFDGQCPVGEEPDLGVSQDPLRALLGGGVDGPGQSVLRVDRLPPLRSDAYVDQRVQLRVLQARLEDGVLVGVDLPADDGLTEPERRADDDDLGESALGVEGEDHAGAGKVRADHGLDADGEGDLEVVEAHPLPVVDGAVGVEGRVAAVHRLQQPGGAAHIQVRLLLAGEAGLRQVLGGGAAAYGDFRVRTSFVAPQLLVRRHDLGPQSWGQWFSEGHRPDRGPDLVQRRPLVQAPDLLLDPPAQSVSVQQLTVRVGRRGEPRGNAHTGIGQVGGHLTQGGVLAPDTADVQPAEFRERDDAPCAVHDDLRTQYGIGRPDGVRRSSGAGLWGCFWRGSIRMRCMVATSSGNGAWNGLRIPRSRREVAVPQCRVGQQRGPTGPYLGGADLPMAGRA